MYLWKAVDQDYEVVVVFLQKRRNGAAGEYQRFDLCASGHWLK